MIEKIKRVYKKYEQKAVSKANRKFDQLSNPAKKKAVIMFGVFSAVVCTATMTGVFSIDSPKFFTGESILIPKTEIPMENKRSPTELIPLGKMKGEVNGEFDSFYVAIDKEARVFINRNIKYNESAYEKSEAWKEITMKELKRYGRELHFIPLSNKSKGLKP